VLLFIIGTVLAFDATAYLYSSENSSTNITNESFIMNGINYDIITIRNEGSFLLKKDEIIQNSSEIYQVIYDYYKIKHYPTDKELQDIKEILLKYNDSRNDGDRFKNKEENACVSALFADGRIVVYGKPVTCINDSTCDINAQLVFQAYKDGAGWGSYQDVLKPLKDFSYAHFSTEKIMNNAFTAIDNITESNVYTSLNSIKNNIPTLQSDLSKIEKNLFRIPRLNDSQDTKDCYLKCYGICPSFNLDDQALKDLDSKLGTLLSKVQPFSNYGSMAAKISNNTVLRIEFKQNETYATNYTQKFVPLQLKGAIIINNTENTLKYIINTTIKNELEELKKLHTEINASIEKRNFTNIDSSISRYSYLVDSVNKTTPEVYDIYNSSVYAKKRANAMVFILDSKDLDSSSRILANGLKNQTAQMDIAFNDGLLAEVYISFYENYTNISSTAEKILQDQKQNPVTFTSSKFRSFARKINTGIASLIETNNLMETKDIKDKKLAVFGGFSLITFLSIAALMFIGLLLLLLQQKKSKRSTKVAFFISYFVAIFALLLLSTMLYLYLDKSALEADIEEFIQDFSTRNNTTVVLDLTNVSNTDAEYMKSCTSAFVDTLRSKNISVTFYKIADTTCIINTNSTSLNESKTKQECDKYLINQTSVFNLGYSTIAEKPNFEIIYTNKAKINGDTAYYKSCPLVGLFQ
jgi:hypothetical protein